MLTIKNNKSEAIINEIGAYLEKLTLNGKNILLPGNIINPTHGGMAILIPFANRIKGAEYEFNGKKYFLKKNKEGNAIHGLVLDKKFSILKANKDSVSLSYTLEDEGYPTRLEIEVKYSIGNSNLETEFFITNNGNSNAPLVVGAHPYFLIEGYWKINPKKVKKCLLFNKIPNGEFIYYEIEGNIDYDDCFYIGNMVELSSDNINLQIETTDMPYFQIYTGVKGAVALEPMSGIPDAYHNKIGLYIIKPGEKKYYSFIISLK
ncbi:aldose 1-epimerase [Caldisphaera lagunensis]|uniref:aldose 1-epimerase n=1 Tax=Caldisphaera lagunensis TaxID=200415 RepID=UPI000B2F4C37|nr:aldose 1-epimerase [Caldisphaera lagunensis]